MKDRLELDRIPVDVPRLTWREVLEVKDGEELTPEDQYSLETYFSHFARPTKDEQNNSLCVGCKKKIRSGIEGFLLGGAPDSTTMECGIVHGECFCRACGWPARAYHFDVGPIKRMECVLQYHPAECVVRGREEK